MAKTKLKLKGKGNEEYRWPASDVIISIKRIVDDDTVWNRRGDNLIYTHPISLADSFNAKPIQIKTLDGRILKLNIDKYITP